MATYQTLFQSDLDQLRAHYLRLDQVDRSLRFFGRTHDETIIRHCDKVNWSQASITGCFIDGTLRAVAELHFDSVFFARHGEVALSVEPAWRRQGVGTELLRRTLGVARNRRLSTLSIACLYKNRPMQQIARKFSKDLHSGDGEIQAEIAVAQPTFLSLQEEAYAISLGIMGLWKRTLGLVRLPKPIEI